jgi:hypothetical protein
MYEAERLTKSEAIAAGMETLKTSYDYEELEHVMDVLDKLEHGNKGEDSND